MKARPRGLSNNQKRQLSQLIEQAAHAYMSQSFGMCENLCKRIESIQPGNPDVANMRGGMCLATSRPEDGMLFFRQAVKQAPRRYEFRINLGFVLLETGRADEALVEYQEAERLKPNEQQALLGACRALQALGRNAEAGEYLRRVQKQQLTNAEDALMLAIACRDLGYTHEALKSFVALLIRFPGHLRGQYEKAATEMQVGDMSAAQASLEQLLSLRPDHAPALALLAEIKMPSSADDPMIGAIHRALEHIAPDSPERVDLHVALAKCLQRLHDYDAAFLHFRMANEIRAKHSTYNAAAELAHLDEIGRCFTARVLEHRGSVDADAPVFIVGMPRCGSTLTEQILAAHPECSGRGESSMFENALASLHPDKGLTLEEMAKFSPTQWMRIGTLYVERLYASGPVCKRITDKSLSNIRMLGAIHCALPHARIIHVRRHPLDTCLSIFTSNLSGSSYDYGLRLDTLGMYYRQYLSLMQHWRKILPAESFYELRYEDLVERQEDETRRLLEFCGLGWSDQCLEFQNAGHRVETASIMQVRQSMYSKSVDRWKRYEKELAPLIEMLGTEYPSLS
ncbi:MAG: hypothetical protein AUJ58_02670 [Zetaproteobacteria bacterium CG1_02_55_237]|nr:MAG: hypothetical protein AUJ58_02670 [Zetaproteobacteria bacterium CG1_02_55_237]